MGGAPLESRRSLLADARRSQIPEPEVPAVVRRTTALRMRIRFSREPKKTSFKTDGPCGTLGEKHNFTTVRPWGGGGRPPLFRLCSTKLERLSLVKKIRLGEGERIANQANETSQIAGRIAVFGG